MPKKKGQFWMLGLAGFTNKNVVDHRNIDNHENYTYALRFPATESYTPEQMKAYNETWHEVGDVREWEAAGYPVRTHRVIEALKRMVARGVRMQDNVIDSTPYFLEANKTQALGERRVGLGVMGLLPLLFT